MQTDILTSKHCLHKKDQFRKNRSDIERQQDLTIKAINNIMWIDFGVCACMGHVHVSASHNLIEYGLDKQAGSIEFFRNIESWQSWHFCIA